jgi:pteridine reductase
MRPVAFITGGTRRVGAAIARRLHESHDLILHSRESSEHAVSFVEALCDERPGSATLTTARLEFPDEIRNAADLVADRRISLLVHNASHYAATPWPAADASGRAAAPLTNRLASMYVGLQQHFAVNATAPILLADALLDNLKCAALHVDTSIVFILDTQFDHPLGTREAYSMSRAAGAMAVKALARSLAPKIRVNAVAPGTVLWSDSATKALSEEAVRRETAVGRTGSPGDVAEAVLFLASQSFVTGQILRVDGGRHLFFEQAAKIDGDNSPIHGNEEG